MISIPKEVYVANNISLIFWVFIVLSVVIIGIRNERVRAFKYKMVANWKQSLTIAVVCYIGRFIGSLNFSILANIGGLISVFCQCLIGLTIASSIGGFEPLPVVKAFIQHDKQRDKLIQMFVCSFFTLFLVLFTGQFSINFCQQVFGEVAKSSESINVIHQNRFLVFFTFLSGAGIAEEAMYRLVFLSLFWKLTHKPWLAILLSAILFGIYHLSPLSSMYQVYWHYPITQFIGSSFAGIILGFIYTKCGYETSVLGHTLVDWLPALIYLK